MRMATRNRGQKLRRASSWGFCIWSVVAVAFSAEAIAATRVELVIDEPLPNRQVAWPLTTGVPFPRGGLVDEQNCRLVDDRGSEHPLQSRVAATWDAERTSIRWLTIDFIAQPGRSYWLEFGPDVKRKEFASQSTVTEAGEGIVEVRTGPLSVEFLKNGPSALGAIRLDQNRDATFDDGETLATGAGNGDHYYLNQTRQRFSSEKDGTERQITVENTGPIRYTVRVDGFYSGPNGERIVSYRTRYHLFAGLGLIKVVDEFKILGPTAETRFADIGLTLSLNLGTDGRTISASGSADLTEPAVEVDWKERTNSISAYQSAYRHYGNPGYEAAIVEVSPAGEDRIQQSDRIGGWMQVATETGVVTGSLRWFWQQFPKEWEVSSNEFTLHLWSPHGGELDFSPHGVREFFGKKGTEHILEFDGPDPPASILRRYMFFGTNDALTRVGSDGQGTNKHHEVYYHFAPSSEREASAEYGRLAARQPVALATGEWNCSTDVFGPLMPRPNDMKYEAIIDRLFGMMRYAQDAFGDYGWWVFGSGPHYHYNWDPVTRRHYADPRRFEYHTYQKETRLWWCYLRSGERKFYDWAIPSENHWVDIAVAHVPMKFECDWVGGDRAEKPRTLHWRPGDWTVDNAVQFSRNHHTAEAWLRSGAQFWASYHRTLETTTLAYYITGDERYNDVIEYWRDYWGELAGVTLKSDNAKPWHREQPWYIVAEKAGKDKTWAEMIRDYAPFSSGMRHELTLFLSLCTLYEHTWDPVAGQVMQEFADAFFEPDGPIGVWRSQDNAGPSHADAPWMAHYWLPAMWKYDRVTRDPKMPGIFKKYFDAVYGTDPFRGHIGVYSNAHLGYGYYFTRDPRYLTLCKLELDDLMSHAEPLARPEELGSRIYNPYASIMCLSTVPRAEWALRQAELDGVPIPPPPLLKPQRAPIALVKTAGKPLAATFWSYDEQLEVLGPDANIVERAEVTSRKYSTHDQPFDRTTPGFRVFLHEMTVPGELPAGFYSISTQLEAAVLSTNSSSLPLVNAAVPVALEKSAPAMLRVAPNVKAIVLESGQAASLRATTANGEALPLTAKGTEVTVELPPADTTQTVIISNEGRLRSVWFRIKDMPAEACWVSFGDAPFEATPQPALSAAVLPAKPEVPGDDETFVAGRFGKALVVRKGQELRIPDQLELDGKTVELADLKEGTLECWVKLVSDPRMSLYQPNRLFTNGPLSMPTTYVPWNEWAHVAISWRPTVRDPNESVVHYYVNGLDRQYYRSVWWPGYGSRASFVSKDTKRLGEFLTPIPPGIVLLIDELRLSATARYTDPTAAFGPQLTYNPYTFEPSGEPFRSDSSTDLLLHFDGTLENTAGTAAGNVSATLGR